MRRPRSLPATVRFLNPSLRAPTKHGDLVNYYWKFPLFLGKDLPHIFSKPNTLNTDNR